MSQENQSTEPIAEPTTETAVTVEEKSYAKAREAYTNRDAEATRAEHAKPHDHRTHHHEYHKGGASEFVKSIVFGGLDGIITTFAIVSAAAGSDSSFRTVLIFGFANVLADAFSMGFGEFISGSAERDFAMAERQREEWEVEVDKEMEKQEMVELYVQKGISEPDAITMVDIISKDPKIFVDFMMIDELQILCNMEDKWEPLKQGAVMFGSFIAFGLLPLLPYLGGKGQGPDWVFGISCAIVAVALLILGSIKGHLTSMPIPKASSVMLFNGVISGGVSYGIGVLVEYIVTEAAGKDAGCGA